MLKRIFLYFYQHSLIRFLIVGVFGLITDACVLYALRHAIGLIPAKIVSYIIAFTVTWGLNRFYTFKSDDPNRVQEWLRYALIYIVTGCLHVLIFSALTYRYNQLYVHPVWALFITAVIVAFVNFILSKQFAFKKISLT